MTKKPPRIIGIFTLAMINVAVIASIKNWPLTAEYGFSSLFFLIMGALLFFVPVSLVSAELATGWPEHGGIFAWVKEALGHKWGFLAIWLLWIENVVWYPTILSFIAATLAFSFNPALAENQLYMYCVMLVTFWAATFVNMRGMKTSGLISTVGAVFGTLIPGVLIIVLGLLWGFLGHPMEISFDWGSFIPKFEGPQQFVFLAGIVLGYAGMEMSAVHARDVINPQKNYPRAIFLSGAIIVALTALGTLAIAMVIPQGKISLVAGGMEAIAIFLNNWNIGWMVPLVAILVTIGALGQMSSWAVGPCRGLLAAAQAGELPPALHKENRHGMPVNLLILQAVIVTILASVFLFMPNVNTSFWMLLALVSQLYIVMYFLLFITAIVLRYKKPDVKRTYKVPGGKLGMWAVSGIGFVTCLGAMIIGFFPPEQLDTGNIIFYESFLLLGTLLLCLVPFIILKFKRPSWNQK
ncbi:MAG: amino acid permease [Candidatus Algichlamydia australiensis]|nr:amino acid permease [Chlamydiales bacterium]